MAVPVSCARARAQRSRILCVASGLGLCFLSASTQAAPPDSAEPGRTEAEAPSLPAPAPATPGPSSTAAASAPAAANSSKWPVIPLAAASAGVGLTVLVVQIVSSAVVDNAERDIEFALAGASVRGCTPKSKTHGPCDRALKHMDTIDTASTVFLVAGAVGMPLVGGLAAAALFGGLGDERTVEVTPTVGGVVVRGSF